MRILYRFATAQSDPRSPGIGSVSFNEYALYDALGLAGSGACGEISPGELLDAALARMAELNPNINAVITRWKGRRRAIAAGLPDGPFRGVPFLLKDLIMAYGGEPCATAAAVPGFRAAAGRGARAPLQGRRPRDLRQDQHARVRHHRRHGARALRPARNPWNLERTPGGSQRRLGGGGGGRDRAGRARRNDGGGSIRIPASSCGLFGLKPSRGRNPVGPDAASSGAASSSSTPSPAPCATARPCSTRPRGLSGTATRGSSSAAACLEETTRDPGRLRIAFSLDPGLARSLHPENRAAMQAVTGVFAQAGHEFGEVSLPLRLNRSLRTTRRWSPPRRPRRSAWARASSDARRVRRTSKLRPVSLAGWARRSPAAPRPWLSTGCRRFSQEMARLVERVPTCWSHRPSAYRRWP